MGETSDKKKKKNKYIFMNWGYVMVGLGLVMLLLSIFLAQKTETSSFQPEEKLDRNRLPSAAFLIHTFDGYRRYWPGWFHFFHLHHPEPVWPVYFATEEKNIENLIPEESSSRYKNVKTGKGEWGYRLRRALEQIPEEYVLYLQEDMWLTGTLRSEYLERSLQRMKKHNLNHLKLQANCHHNAGLQSRDLNDSRWYVVSHQPGLWRKSFLLSTLKDVWSPFQHETQTNADLHLAPGDAQWCRCNLDFVNEVFPYEDVSRRGQLRPIGQDMLDKADLGFEVSSDEVMFRADR